MLSPARNLLGIFEQLADSDNATQTAHTPQKAAASAPAVPSPGAITMPAGPVFDTSSIQVAQNEDSSIAGVFPASKLQQVLRGELPCRTVCKTPGPACFDCNQSNWDIVKVPKITPKEDATTLQHNQELQLSEDMRK